jgi:hypothetical protein
MSLDLSFEFEFMQNFADGINSMKLPENASYFLSQMIAAITKTNKTRQNKC